MQLTWISMIAIAVLLLIAGAMMVLTARFLIRNRPGPTGRKYFWDE
jgi:hypothetical protein